MRSRSRSAARNRRHFLQRDGKGCFQQGSESGKVDKQSTERPDSDLSGVRAGYCTGKRRRSPECDAEIAMKNEGNGKLHDVRR